ncbi:MAG: GNAT family N-acetyltransferase [Eubacteriales bacterium]|nr:GNAT family N-acetyltransferase [Eubacteriales bacterium]
MDLSIRPVEDSDLDDIARLANDYEIAKMTACLPYPYTKEHAKTWLDYLKKNQHEQAFAVCGDALFMGIVGLVHEPEHNRAELGYWLGQDYWNSGYMSGAAGMAVGYAFSMLGVGRIYARCFDINTASKRVLEKNGLVQEGCLKKLFIRFGTAMDLLCFGLLKENDRR